MADAKPDTRTRLLDLAEAEIRLRGYHAVSFRDLAESLGIKSASVHYYFRQKEDLGLALVARYSDRFFDALNAATPADANQSQRLSAFHQAYRTALRSADRLCLCGMLGAESRGLPETLSNAVGAFFQANIDWLADGFDPDLSPTERESIAGGIVARLQGAMMMARAMDDLTLFDRATGDLVAS